MSTKKKNHLPNGLMQLSASYSQPAINYANQGNSIIGIRDSGKTYAATKAAEELMKQGISIIAFDPTGVWQHLRNGINGNPGYPVVVAGGNNGDLPLTDKNAVQILDAALKENISIVFDFRGISTSSKTKWLRIVSDCIEHLNTAMGSGKYHYGLRHVFIEEAAEFVPQRPQPGGQLVYSRIETMARMGRNFGLGYTLINQRAEEISKAIFEISEQVMVFRQAGKNSLKSIKDWLNYRGLENREKIVSSLPNLKAGECWVINNQQNTLIKISAKETFHPDPKTSKTTLPANTHTADRTAFINRMKQTMEPAATIKQPTVAAGNAAVEADEIKRLNGVIEDLQNQLQQSNNHVKLLQAKAVGYCNYSENLVKFYNGLKKALQEMYSKPLPVLEELNLEFKHDTLSGSDNMYTGKYGMPGGVHGIKGPTQPIIAIGQSNRMPVNNGKLPTGEYAFLNYVGQFTDKGITKVMLTAFTGYKRSSRDAYIQRLKQKDLITENAGRVFITDTGIEILGDNLIPLPTGQALRQHWLNTLPEGEAKIFAVCIENYPVEVSKDHISTVTGYMRSSRDAYIQRLSGKELITTGKGVIKAADYLF